MNYECDGQTELLDLLDARDRKGHWRLVERGERGYSAGSFRCSVCGEPCRCYSLTKYCANCGAKMEEKQ